MLFFHKFLRLFLDFWLPVGSCTLCHDDGLFLTTQYGICQKCFLQLEAEQKPYSTFCCFHCLPSILEVYPLSNKKYHICFEHQSFFLYSLFEYWKTFKDVLYKIKFHKRFELKRCFAYILYNNSFFRESLGLGFVLVSVPSTTESEKGYSVVSLIFNELKKIYGVPSRNLLYSCSKIPQKTLKREERFENICGKILFKGKACGKVLLIDDVGTTGSTICESLKVLFKHQVKEVRVLLLSISPS